MLFAINLVAQETTELSKEKEKKTFTPAKREIGINMMALAAQFIPFKESQGLHGPFNLSIRRGYNRHYFNFQFGMEINGDGFGSNAGPSYVHLSLGYLRKSNPFGRFRYYTSYNFMLAAGPFNIPNQDDFEDGGVGGSLGFGFEYQITDFISISTESMFYIGNRDGEFRPKFIPPFGLFMFAKLR